MSKQLIVSEIKLLLETLKEQHDQIAHHEGAIPRIELDIMMGNVRRLYENLYLLNKEVPAMQQSSGRQPDIAQVPQDSVAPPAAIREVPLATEAAVSHIDILSEKAATLDLKPEVQPAEEVPVTVASTVAAPPMQPEELLASIETSIPASVTEIHHEEEMPRATLSATPRKKTAVPTASLFDEPESLGDTISAKPTVYDTISARSEDKSIGKKMQSEPVTDLKKSIGINEKFSFINELFDGDLDAYNQTIEKLNSCDSIGTALAVLEGDIARQLTWNTQGSAYLNLRKLVERRYA